MKLYSPTHKQMLAFTAENRSRADKKLIVPLGTAKRTDMKIRRARDKDFIVLRDLEEEKKNTHTQGKRDETAKKRTAWQ